MIPWVVKRVHTEVATHLISLSLSLSLKRAHGEVEACVLTFRVIWRVPPHLAASNKPLQWRRHGNTSGGDKMLGRAGCGAG